MTARPMILPPHEVTDGTIVGGRWPLAGDDRVPSLLRSPGAYFDFHEVRVAGHSPYVDDACPTGRHIFDVLESTIERDIGEPHTDDWQGYEYDFRARLTCVRCGKILHWEGTRTETTVCRVQAAPIAAGDLLAQQVHSFESWADRDMSTWAVYRDGAEVGVISWASGKRGRAYFVGRFRDWPDGETVEGADPAAVLRKLARATAPVTA